MFWWGQGKVHLFRLACGWRFARFACFGTVWRRAVFAHEIDTSRRPPRITRARVRGAPQPGIEHGTRAPAPLRRVRSAAARRPSEPWTKFSCLSIGGPSRGNARFACFGQWPGGEKQGSLVSPPKQVNLAILSENSGDKPKQVNLAQKTTEPCFIP